MSTSPETKTDSNKTETTDKSRPAKAKSETEATTKTGTVDIAALAVKDESKPVEASIAQKGSLTVTETLKHFGDRPWEITL